MDPVSFEHRDPTKASADDLSFQYPPANDQSSTLPPAQLHVVQPKTDFATTSYTSGDGPLLENHAQGLHPPQPATPRMLRSVSGSVKGSRSDVRVASGPPGHESPHYGGSGDGGSHSRTPSVGRPVVSPMKKELLPPAAINRKQQQTQNPQNSNPQPRVSHHHLHSQPQTPQNQTQNMTHQHQQQQQTQQHAQQHAQQHSAHSQQSHGLRQSLHLSHQSQSQPAQSQPHGSSQHGSSQQGSQQFHRKSIGDWDFVKTIGAGSMGKVKLAQHNSTGEICAVKIVPRAAKLYQRAHANDPPLNAQASAQRQKEFEKEVARDKRTIREGALGRLLFHPFICRLYEMVPMTNHYYMLFEYVEGGQMLDYIVSHGSLKEKNARKFARGIALALEYCHRNNVVHRDLKIENIMINRKGDIKIIDFGLSNLYSPKTLLKTYCGSLYFAAPELLSAKPYTGPEVDVWSFGVVLFVLVCGKVPFDDQSVLVLHEKIKKGSVVYPADLSKECVSLLSRMLVVDPLKRALLYEVMQHPWMNKGYDGVMSCYLPRRTPLSLPLDPDIIKAIASFDLGSPQTITEELTSILSSVEYQMSVENWYKIAELGRDYASAPNSLLLPDPTGGYHPLISIYFLISEMRSRKRAKEEAAKQQTAVPGQSLQQHSPAPTPRQTSVPPPQQQVPTPPVQNSPLPFPEQAHTLAPSMVESNSTRLHELSQLPIQQQSPTVKHDTLDPKAGFNSLLRRMSSRKKTTSPTRNTSESASNHSIPTVEVGHVGAASNTPQRSYLPQNLSPEPVASTQSPDPMVRRGVSMKVTAKEKSSSNLDASPVKQQAPAQRQPGPRHDRSHSTTVAKPRFTPVEYLPPLPNLDAEVLSSTKPAGKSLHPTARAKSVGGHVRKESYNSRSKTQQQPPLPNVMAGQNSDELVGGGRDDGFFDDITIDDIEHQIVPQLSDREIIEQFNNAKPNSMPSIEYPKTLFLKGFFSVQTTSTKPLPVIRYNIIRVLSQLGVKFQEVKGGFVCVHTPSLSKISPEGSANATIASTNEEEEKLYGDAFKSTSSSIEGYHHEHESERTPLRQPSLHLQTQALSPPSVKTHRSSNSMGHRRKISIGNSILNRKKNGSQTLMPPNTPASAKIRLLDDDYEDYDDSRFTEDDSLDSLGGIMVGGGSDMLVSSRLEQRVNHKHTASNSGAKPKKSPLKFEIHVVKVPLVGLYGVQFKKILGNTWNYKTLAGQILNELNL